MVERIKCPETGNGNRIEILNKNITNWLYSEPMMELLNMFGIQAKLTGDIGIDSEIFEAVMEVWNQRKDGKERWKIKNDQFVEDNKQGIMECVEKLGMSVAGVPYFEPDYILPLGGARYTNLIRPKEAKYLIDQNGWKDKMVCGLACYREKSEMENESWSEYCPQAHTEFDAMSKGLELVFQLGEAYSDMISANENINLQSCMRKYDKSYNGGSCYCLAAPSSDPLRRANTYETVEFFLRKFKVPEGSGLLFTTSNIYTTTQFLRLIPLAIKYDLQIDCIGISAANQIGGKNVLTADHYLQEIYDSICAIKKFENVLKNSENNGLVLYNGVID